MIFKACIYDPDVFPLCMNYDPPYLPHSKPLVPLSLRFARSLSSCLYDCATSLSLGLRYPVIELERAAAIVLHLDFTPLLR